MERGAQGSCWRSEGWHLLLGCCCEFEVQALVGKEMKRI
jgi:hypothetical protein